MKKHIKIEWMKLIRQRKAKVLLVAGWLGAMILAVGNLFISSRAGFTVIDPDQMPLTAITLLGGLLLPLIAYVISADFTAGEFSKGTFKYSLQAPVTSRETLVAKFTALAIYNAVLLTGVLLVMVIMNLIWMTDGIVFNMPQYVGAYVITLIPMCLVSLWGMFFGSWFSTGLSIALGIIGVIAMNIGSIFFPVLASVSPLGYMDLYSMIVYGNATVMAVVSVLMYVLAYYIILIAMNLRKIQTVEL